MVYFSDQVALSSGDTRYRTRDRTSHGAGELHHEIGNDALRRELPGRSKRPTITIGMMGTATGPFGNMLSMHLYMHWAALASFMAQPKVIAITILGEP
jgi:hypothetical protein